MKRLALVVVVAALFAVPVPASADLIYDMNISTTGNGLGAVYTIVTVHDPGGPGTNDGTESGCINQDGSFSPCLGGIEGGDNTAINNVWTLSNTSAWGAVVNIAETGQDITVTLTDLYLTFCDATNPLSCHTAFYNGPDLELTQGTGTGIGGEGFVFTLNAAEAAIVAGLGPTLTISGGVQFANGSTNNGSDTMNLARIEAPVPVPEPATMLLLGTGLVGLGRFARRRRR